MAEVSFSPPFGTNPPLKTRIPTLVLAALAVVIPAVLFYEHNASYAAFYCLGAWGLFSALRAKDNRLSREEWTLFAAVVLVVATAWLSYAYNGFHAEGWERFLSSQTPLLGIIPIFLLFRNVKGGGAVMWWPVALGAIVCGVLVLTEMLDRFSASKLVAALDWYRASGGDNPLPLALSSLVLGAATAAGWPYFSRLGWGGKLFWAVSLGMAAFSLYMTGTRGAWVAIPIYLVLLSVLYWPKLPTAKKIALLVALVTLPVLALQSENIGQRYDRAVAEATQYYKGNWSRNSIGARLDTYKVAWLGFLERPLLGWGPGGWTATYEYATAKDSTIRVRQLPNTHNMYLASLNLRGILGFLAEMALFTVLFRVFARRIRNSSGVPSQLALAGMLVLVGFLVMGLTWVPLGWWRKQVVLFAFLIAGFWGAIRAHERDNQGEGLG